MMTRTLFAAALLTGSTAHGTWHMAYGGSSRPSASMRLTPPSVGAAMCHRPCAIRPQPDPARLADTVRLTIEAAVDAGDLAAAEAAVAMVDRALAMAPGDPLLRHYQGYALYRAGSLAFGVGGADRARPLLEKARDVLEPLAKGATIPETHALLSGVYGMLIGVSKVPMIAGMRLGPKSTESMDRAVAAGPKNPRVWVLRGIGAVNTPAMFGGGLEKAEAHLKQALALLETDAPAAGLPAWGRADARTWLGQVYAKQGRTADARAELEAAMALQPRNAWIRTVLLPSLDRKR